MKVLFALFLTIVCHTEFSNAQNSVSSSDSLQYTREIIVTPGKQYEAGGLHEFFLGEHWRDLWATPISVKEISFYKYGNGLTPVKKGGGLQTKSLRLKGNDGNEYKFRLIDKNPTNSLPLELQNSIYADIIQDQISIGLPGSSLITYPLMTETGILSPKPDLIFMPDDEGLKQFRSDFGGKLGVIEINPRAGKKVTNNFAGADKVINGFEIFEETEQDNDERVDQKEFLKARLMDVFLGDRDRHADQWQWAGYKQNGKRIWKPIPRDRDYAFGRYDGLFPWMSGLFAHSLVGFNEDIPALVEITWSGRHLDRRFLNELDKSDWDSISNYLTSRLTDGVIENAVRQMPPEMFAREGSRLIKMLKSRRDQLMDASNKFYELFSSVVDVYASDKTEFSEITVLNDKEVELTIFEREKETGKKKNKPFYKKKFNKDVTNEIRLYLLGGDDNVVITGKKDNDILLRIIGGDGKDRIINNSDSKIKFYDANSNTGIKNKRSIYFNDDKIKIPKKDIDKYEPLVEDRYGFFAFTPILNYNTDDGYILGGGPNFVKFGFRANPYLYFLELTGAYATFAEDYDIGFHGDFTKLIHNSRVEFFLRASELDFNRFYGFGNETVRYDELAEEDFYKTNQKDFTFEPRVSVHLNKNSDVILSTILRYSDIAIEEDELAGQINPYGTGKMTTAGITTGFNFNNKNNLIFPERGMELKFDITYFPKVFNNRESFGRVRSSIISYTTFKTLTSTTLVLKASGEVLFGDYPFYYGATLGGLKNLRGFSRERFLGDGVLSGQSELRFYVTTLNLFFPAKFGLSAMGDVGRVFAENESSKKWHSTYGCGVWLNFLDALTLNFTVARSPEVTKYYFATGFNL